MQPINHIVQSKEWTETKAEYGTKTLNVGDVYLTLHMIPFTPYFVAYCPKVNPFSIDWELLTATLKGQRCVAVNFDVPNVATDTTIAAEAQAIFVKRCVKSPKNTFASHTILIDLTGTEAELLARMHPKHRYNIKVAHSRGAGIRLAETIEDFNIFYQLLEETAVREHYYIRSRNYYLNIWQMLKPKSMAEIIICEHQGTPLGAWMLLFYENTMYYPYGGSAEAGARNKFFPGNLIGWEAMLLGRSRGCTVFDMWGATGDLNNTSHPWWGFTNFKLKFGGRLVKFIDSYDLILNKKIYSAFLLANNIRWKILRLIR